MAASSPLAWPCQDDIVCLLPGVGHTGPRPFNSGWYRGLRGLAGAVSYTAMLRTWTPLTHHEAPLAMRAAVAALLMCHARKACVLSLVPRDVVFQVRRVLPPSSLGSWSSCRCSLAIVSGFGLVGTVSTRR